MASVEYPRIPKDKDLRRKLTDEDREDIRKMYADGGSSYNDVARHFGVSKRTIIFIVKPETLQRVREQQRIRRQLGLQKMYRGPEDMRKHRARQRELNPEAWRAYVNAENAKKAAKRAERKAKNGQ